VIVANSIFADGAAALVGCHPSRRRAVSGPPWQLERQWSSILPDSQDEMGWTIGDHGFEMNLSARVPAIIGGDLPRIITDALAEAGLAPADVASWAVHPGGPRILAATAEALGLDRDALAVSWDVLAGHGNMSSATILFILDRLLGAEPRDAAGPTVALAFGPGLTVEVALFGR
jgi:predicted naringenin-chalcone synthase